MPTPLELTLRTLSDAKSPIGIFRLPCGYIDPAGNLHEEIQIREMTGAEEDILASSLTSVIDKLNAIMSNCIVRIGNITERGCMSDIVKDMTSGDRLFVLLKIRQLTLGNEFPFEASCPKCNDKQTRTILLSDLTVRDQPERGKKQVSVTTPSGKQAVLKILTGREEVSAAEIAAKNPNDIVTALMLTRVVSVGGVPADLASVKALSWSDRKFLRAEMQNIDGGVDTEIENTCDKCGNEFKTDLDIGGASFFFPSETAKP